LKEFYIRAAAIGRPSYFFIAMRGSITK